MSVHSDRAEGYFEAGYNCAQSVFLAFSDLTGMDEKAAARLAAPFGGGMGRLREVCGAMTAAFMVAGILYGYDDPAASEEKAALYADIQAMAGQFAEENGSIICRELLGEAAGAPGPVPAARTPAFSHTRQCGGYVRSAALILDRYIESKQAGNAHE